MNRPSDQEVETLILDLLDDAIPAGDFGRLQEILAADESARRLYLELVALHNLLELHAEQVPQIGGGNVIPASPVIPIGRVMRKQQRRAGIRSLIAAMAALILVALGLHLILARDPEPAVSIRSAPHSSFTITHPESADPARERNGLVPGSSLELVQGTLELDFASGVRSILRAPASITFTDTNHLYLREGVAWFDVPEKAVGFTATTPNIQVVDLGTEFGVVTSPRLATSEDEVHVFSGSVRARTLIGLKQAETLSAGQARKLHLTGKWMQIPHSGDPFLRKLPPGLPKLSWSFDRLEGDSFPTTGNFPLTRRIESVATTDQVTQVRGKHGNAVSFLPGEGYLKTSWPGIDSDRPRTIACWIKCPPHSPVGSIVEWGVPFISSSKWRVCLNPELGGEGGVRGAFRTEFGEGYVIGTKDLRDGEWHHVVSVYDGSGTGDGETIRLYIDGQHEPISASRPNRISTILDDPRSKPCLIGADFHGIIDDLRIFQGVLPERVIRDLHESTPGK